MAEMDRKSNRGGGDGNHHTAIVPHNNVLADAGQAQKDPEFWADRLVALKVIEHFMCFNLV